MRLGFETTIHHIKQFAHIWFPIGETYPRPAVVGRVSFRPPGANPYLTDVTWLNDFHAGRRCVWPIGVFEI